MARPQSDTGGVTSISLDGRLGRERERLIGMTEDERAFRARYLKSMDLAPEEPLLTKEYYRECYNPIRRFYMAPLNKVEALLVPVTGTLGAAVIRNSIARIGMGIVGIYLGWYYFKYNKHTWEKSTGWRLRPTRDAAIPGTKNYRGLEKPSSFATYGFENSPI